MRKPHYKFVFVVLVYRNTQDLIDFFESNTLLSRAKVIVVNSFYDDESEQKFIKIASEYNADFLSVPNKGYGAGNNRGVEYAIENYDFDYLIISNADITIEKFPETILDKYKDSLLAPKLITRTGKNQNPSSPFKSIPLIETLLYKVYKGNHRKIVIVFYAWSRLQKIIYYSISKLRRKVHAPHGAFFLIPRNLLMRLVPLYNEDMFLFYEENHLGKLANQKGIKTIYVPEIIIRHKEDGSVALLNADDFELMKDSYMTLYEYWNKK